MARPSFSFKRWGENWALALGLVFCLLLASCLDLSLDVQLNGESAGTVKLDAFSYRIAQGIQLQDGDATVPPLPVTKEEWTAILALVPGTSLVSFDAKNESLGTRTKTVVSFANAKALEGLFAVFRQRVSLVQTGTSWTFSLAWLNPNFKNMAKQDKDLWNALWGEKEWTMALSAPRAVRVVSGGGQTDASRATRKIRLSEFTSTTPPAEWKLVW